MSAETTGQQEAQAELETAWHAFELWTGSRDEDRFRQNYLGHYADRAAFGTELLSQVGADRRLYRLPDWLRAYIRLDGEAVVADFEAAGHFWVFDAPDGSGAYVFDVYERDSGDG